MGKRVFNRRQQRGITLITAMIVLLLLTLLGLASIEDTTLEEKMAGNLRSRNLAFQAAESALREGENYILDIVEAGNEPDFDGSGGHYEEMDDVLQSMAASWAIPSAVRSYVGPALPNLAGPPVYIVEKFEALQQGADLTVGAVPFYRVTARALGGTDTTEVILQSIVKPN